MGGVLNSGVIGVREKGEPPLTESSTSQRGKKIA